MITLRILFRNINSIKTCRNNITLSQNVQSCVRQISVASNPVHDRICTEHLPSLISVRHYAKSKDRKKEKGEFL